MFVHAFIFYLFFVLLFIQVDFEQQQEECEYYRHKKTELEEQLQKQTKLKEEAEEQKQVCNKITLRRFNVHQRHLYVHTTLFRRQCNTILTSINAILDVHTTLFQTHTALFIRPYNAVWTPMQRYFKHPFSVIWTSIQRCLDSNARLF